MPIAWLRIELTRFPLREPGRPDILELDSSRMRRPPRECHGESGAGMPYNILLVDDDADFRSEFRELFEDYNFIEAQNGREALDIIRKPTKSIS